MAVPTLKDQVAEGLGRLISQWSDKPNVQGLTKSVLENIQELEVALNELLTERSIFVAVGVQLDILGTLVGEDRNGRLDEPYREAILNRISLNTSNSTAEKIMQILESNTQSPVVRVWDHYPASIHAYVDRGVTNSTPTILESASAAGVHARLMFDVKENSFIGASAFQDEFEFVLENTDNLEVDDGTELANLEVIDTNFTSVGQRSYLPHSLKTETTNPLAAVLDGKQYAIEIGDLILENLDLVELENGDTLEYQIVEEII